MDLSPHFTLEEMIFSQTALRKNLNNMPSGAIKVRLKNTCEQMEKVRDLLGGVAIHISSGYRSASVNRAVGGSATSQHVNGEAVDFTAPAFGTPREIALAIVASKIQYDQIIMEGNWVHISFTDNPRRQNLTAVFGLGKTSYISGIK